MIERENVGDIIAYGIEADIRYAASDSLTFSGAFDLVDAHVFGGRAAPQLHGQRPAQAPRWTVTGSFEAVPLDAVSLDAEIRYESRRFADDQNTLVLPAATEVDAKLSWNFWRQLSLYVAGDNLLGSSIATTESADGVYSLDFPRMIRAGVEFRR
ncbi:MAG: TonB-dependent receptor [Alphaproteobacteria bacterium]|nr:TonB-dependent receptor [Alphaproteobacteria bacterium]